MGSKSNANCPHEYKVHIFQRCVGKYLPDCTASQPRRWIPLRQPPQKSQTLQFQLIIQGHSTIESIFLSMFDSTCICISTSHFLSDLAISGEMLTWRFLRFSPRSTSGFHSSGMPCCVFGKLNPGFSTLVFSSSLRIIMSTKIFKTSSIWTTRSLETSGFDQPVTECYVLTELTP